MKFADRIRRFDRVPASQIQPNPKNWRRHPDFQRSALRGALEAVGVANAVLVRELEGGGLMLVDGHLRTEELGEQDVPILVLDVTEEEADLLLATMDPLAALAESGAQELNDLLAGLAEQDGALAELLRLQSERASEDLLRLLSQADLPSDPDAQADAQASGEAAAETRLLSVQMPLAEDKLLREALALAKAREGCQDTAAALVAIARAYLQSELAHVGGGERTD